MSNKIDLTQFNETNVIKKLSRSKSEEKLDDEIEVEKPKEEKPKIEKRGRKTKYATEEERLEARRQQQRAYRLRKKQELAKLKEQMKETEE